MRVPFPLIRQFVRGGNNCKQELRQLAVFLKLKSIFVNSIFYDINYARISELSGLSESCLRKYIKIFIQLGWCEEIKGERAGVKYRHLKFNTTVKVYELSSCHELSPNYKRVWKNKKTEDLKFDESHSIRDIINEMRLKVISHKKDSFLFLQGLLRDHDKTKRFSKSEWKIERKRIRLKAYFNLVDETFVKKPEEKKESLNFIKNSVYKAKLSTIARNIGRMSLASAYRLMSLAEFNKRIKIQRQGIVTIGPILEGFKLAPNWFIHNGFVCKKPCNIYEFL
jgi:hypothetical protein